jgi:hypothetical protein
MTTTPDAVTKFAPPRARASEAEKKAAWDPKKSEGQLLLDRLADAIAKLTESDRRVATAVRDIEGEAPSESAQTAQAFRAQPEDGGPALPRGSCDTMSGFFPNLRRLTESLESISDRVDANSARLVDKF